MTIRWWVGLLAVLLLALAGCAPAKAAPAAPPQAANAGGTSAQANRIASDAAWAPGELSEHYKKHPEGYTSQQSYDAGARDVIRSGTRFEYRDTQSNVPRVGYYRKDGNRFTAMTADERRITTHFQPDRGEAYLRGLPGSTYR